MFSGTAEPADFFLRATKPLEFNFDIAEDGNYSFAIDLTYDRMQLKGFTKLDLYYILVGPDKHETEKLFEIKIHDGKDFIGKPKDPESKVDFMLSSEIVTGLGLKKGSHTVKLFANGEKSKDIPGMVTIVWKVLKD